MLSYASFFILLSGAKSLLDAAFVVSIPWDMMQLKSSLESSGFIGKLYDCKHFTSDYKKLFTNTFSQELHRNKLGNKINMDDVINSETIIKIQENYSAKLTGFKSLEDYLNEATLKNKINQIKKPLLCLNSIDDFLCPGTSIYRCDNNCLFVLTEIPTEEALKSSFVAIITTIKGGHLGFFDGFLPGRIYLTERICHEYLHGLLQIGTDFKKFFE